MDPDADFTNMKFNYIALAFGFGILTTGIFFLFFGRNYTYDYTNKDLFLPFGILVIIAGVGLMIVFGVRIGQEWITSTDFTKMNEVRVPLNIPESLQIEEPREQSPQNSLMTGAYSGYNINSPI